MLVTATASLGGAFAFLAVLGLPWAIAAHWIGKHNRALDKVAADSYPYRTPTTQEDNHAS